MPRKTVGRPHFSSLKFKIYANTIIIGCLLLGLIQITARTSLQEGQKIYNSFVDSKQKLLSERISKSTDNLKTMIYDYTYWDDMVDLAANPTEEKSALLLAGSLNTYKADVLWIYNQSGELAYTQTVDENKIDPLTSAPISNDDLARAVGQTGGFYDYFAKVPAGILEIHGGSIHPTDDEARQKPQQGFMFVGKLLDESYLSNLEGALEGDLEIIDSPASNPLSSSRVQPRSGKYSFTIDLNDINSQPLALINASGYSADVANILNTFDRLAQFSLVVFLVIIVSSFVLMSRWLIRPLTQIKMALTTRDDRHVSTLKKSSNEFGLIARLTSDSLSLLAKNEAIMSGISQGLIVFDRNNKVERVNGKAQELLGFSEDELLGERFVDRVKASDQEGNEITANDRPAIQVLSKKQAIVSQLSYLTKTGKSFSAEVSVSPIMINDEAIGAIEIFSDRTKEIDSRRAIEQEVAQKTSELRETQARLEASINSLDLGFVITAADNTVVMINSSAKNLLGIPSSNSSSSQLFEKLEAALQTSGGLKTILKRCFERQESSTIPEATFDNHTLRAFIGPVLDRTESGETTAIGCVILLEDISEAIIAARSKDEFFSIASHELRTPLTAIMGNSAMILDQYKEVLQDQTLKEMVDDIHESSERLIGIVSDFLDVSKIELGKLKYEFESVDFDKLCQDVAQELEPLSSSKSTTIRLSSHKVPKLYIDQARTRQVLVNLLGNALKFTDKGQITVDSKVIKNCLEISIADSGKGIPKDRQSLLFRKFQQAGGSIWTRESSKGTGLGLYISRLLVEGMGGQIWLKDSKEGSGSTFCFTLPIDNPSNRSAIAARTANQAEIDTNTGLRSK